MTGAVEALARPLDAAGPEEWAAVPQMSSLQPENTSSWPFPQPALAAQQFGEAGAVFQLKANGLIGSTGQVVTVQDGPPQPNPSRVESGQGPPETGDPSAMNGVAPADNVVTTDEPCATGEPATGSGEGDDTYPGCVRVSLSSPSEVAAVGMLVEAGEGNDKACQASLPMPYDCWRLPEDWNAQLNGRSSWEDPMILLATAAADLPPSPTRAHLPQGARLETVPTRVIIHKPVNPRPSVASNIGRPQFQVSSGSDPRPDTSFSPPISQANLAWQGYPASLQDPNPAMTLPDDDVTLGATGKRPRLAWTPELHNLFVKVVDQLGLYTAVPKTILKMMNVKNLTREQVASHLQKYRLYMKKGAGQGTSTALLSPNGDVSMMQGIQPRGPPMRSSFAPPPVIRPGNPGLFANVGGAARGRADAQRFWQVAQAAGAAGEQPAGTAAGAGAPVIHTQGHLPTSIGGAGARPVGAQAAVTIQGLQALGPLTPAQLQALQSAVGAPILTAAVPNSSDALAAPQPQPQQPQLQPQQVLGNGLVAAAGTLQNNAAVLQLPGGSQLTLQHMDASANHVGSGPLGGARVYTVQGANGVLTPLTVAQPPQPAPTPPSQPQTMAPAEPAAPPAQPSAGGTASSASGAQPAPAEAARRPSLGSQGTPAQGTARVSYPGNGVAGNAQVAGQAGSEVVSVGGGEYNGQWANGDAGAGGDAALVPAKRKPDEGWQNGPMGPPALRTAGPSPARSDGQAQHQPQANGAAPQIQYVSGGVQQGTGQQQAPAGGNSQVAMIGNGVVNGGHAPAVSAQANAAPVWGTPAQASSGQAANGGPAQPAASAPSQAGPVQYSVQQVSGAGQLAPRLSGGGPVAGQPQGQVQQAVSMGNTYTAADSAAPAQPQPSPSGPPAQQLQQLPPQQQQQQQQQVYWQNNTVENTGGAQATDTYTLPQQQPPPPQPQQQQQPQLLSLDALRMLLPNGGQGNGTIQILPLTMLGGNNNRGVVQQAAQLPVQNFNGVQYITGTGVNTQQYSAPQPAPAPQLTWVQTADGKMVAMLQEAPPPPPVVQQVPQQVQQVYMLNADGTMQSLGSGGSVMILQGGASLVTQQQQQQQAPQQRLA